MKTKDDILKEAQEHFGVNVHSNDDGISRRIEHYAMDLFAKNIQEENESLKLQIDGYKMLCKMADVPQVFIDDATCLSLTKKSELTEEDKKWIKEAVDMLNNDGRVK